MEWSQLMTDGIGDPIARFYMISSKGEEDLKGWEHT